VVEVGPSIFQDVKTGQLVSFGEDGQGRITHAYFGEVPVMAFLRQSWYESPLLHLVAVATSLLIFLSAAVAIPVHAWRRRRRDLDSPSRAMLPRLARGIAWGVSLVYLAALALMAASLADPLEIAFGLPPGFRIGAALALVAGLLALGALALAVVVWRRRFWGLGGRVYYTAVALAGLVFLGQLAYWRILPIPF
jgi:hypothetical protein